MSHKGLCELDFSNNDLGTAGAEELCKFLSRDNWLRSLNLRANNIDLEGCFEFLKVLTKNITLLSLDLRENPGFNRKMSQAILEKLSSNMKLFKKKLEEQGQIDSTSPIQAKQEPPSFGSHQNLSPPIQKKSAGKKIIIPTAFSLPIEESKDQNREKEYNPQSAKPSVKIIQSKDKTVQDSSGEDTPTAKDRDHDKESIYKTVVIKPQNVKHKRQQPTQKPSRFIFK